MAPKTSEQFEQIRETRKKQIMDVAIELFAKYGYNHTSISKIAARAKISKGLMYNYFPGKEKLLEAIMDNGMDKMLGLFDPNKDGILTRDEFVYFIDTMFEMIKREQKFYKLYFALMVQPSVWKYFEKKIKPVIDSVMKMMVDYYKRKGVKNPEMEALMVGALFDGISFDYVIYPELFPLDEVRKKVIERFV